MRRLWTIILTFFMLSALVFPAFAEPEEPEPDAYGLTLSAQSAILLDARTGSVLYEKNAEDQRLIASTTKIMTALVALESGQDLDAVYTMTPEWADVEGSSMYFEAGDQISLRGLLYGLMLNSGNDAAAAIAEIVAGSEAAFVDQMNEYAQRLGMNDSHFANPHGLDAEGHYSTAHDMARLMVEAMKNEDFREITATRHVVIDGFELYYHNKLLNLYPYCISGKTGYTKAAGRTLVTASEKDGILLVAVTLGAPDYWNDQIAMYEYGYHHYQVNCLSERGKCFSSVEVNGANTCVPAYCSSTINCLTSDDVEIQQTVYLPDTLECSVEKGACIGKVVYTVDDRTIGTCFLIAGAYADVEREEVSTQWSSDFKNSCLRGGLYPDVQPSSTYRMEGLLSTAMWHHWE